MQTLGEQVPARGQSQCRGPGAGMNWACWSGHVIPCSWTSLPQTHTVRVLACEHRVLAWELTGIPYVAHHLSKCHHSSCLGCPALPFPGLSGHLHPLQAIIAWRRCLLSMGGHLGKCFQCTYASPPSLTPAGDSGNTLVSGSGQG